MTRTVGTDGEKALIDAFKHEFGFAQHMTCFIHVRQNVKLRDCNIPTQFSSDILDDILGKKVGPVYIEGLVDAQDCKDLQEKVKRFVERLQNASQADMECFITWFQNHKTPVIQDSMLRSVREECGLGSPPSQFTTNACEAANSMLKHEVNYKFNNLVREKEREVERVIIGREKYELKQQYQSFQVSETKWFAMSTIQREQHLNKFACAPVIEVSSSGDLNVTVSSECLGRDLTLASSLSVDVNTWADSVKLSRGNMVQSCRTS